MLKVSRARGRPGRFGREAPPRTNGPTTLREPRPIADHGNVMNGPPAAHTNGRSPKCAPGILFWLVAVSCGGRRMAIDAVPVPDGPACARVRYSQWSDLSANRRAVAGQGRFRGRPRKLAYLVVPGQQPVSPECWRAVRSCLPAPIIDHAPWEWVRESARRWLSRSSLAKQRRPTPDSEEPLFWMQCTQLAPRRQVANPPDA